MSLEISRDDILTALVTKLGTSNLEILSYDTSYVEEKVGLLGDHGFVRVNVLNRDSNNEINVSFFTKLFPKQECLKGFAEGAGSFTREEFVYDLFSDFRNDKIDIITKCTPRCYVYQPNNYLLLDNLLEEGYKMPDKSKCFDFSTVLVVLESLAQLHASSLIYEEQKSNRSGEIFRILHGNEERLKDTLYCDSDDFPNKDSLLNKVVSNAGNFKEW